MRLRARLRAAGAESGIVTRGSAAELSMPGRGIRRGGGRREGSAGLFMRYTSLSHDQLKAAGERALLVAEAN